MNNLSVLLKIIIKCSSANILNATDLATVSCTYELIEHKSLDIVGTLKIKNLKL